MAMVSAPPSFSGRIAVLAGRAIRRWPLALALYLPSLLLALLASIPAFVAADTLGHLGPWTARLVAGDFLNTLYEMQNVAGVPPELGASGASVGLAVLIAALGIPLQGLVYALLAGGVLERLVGREEGSFWGACRRWAGPMIWFGILALLAFLVLAGLGLIVLVVLPAGGFAGLLWKPAVFVAWLACVGGLFELARADMVVRRDPRALAVLGRAFALVARPGLFLRALALWLLLALLGAAYNLATGAAVLSLPSGLPALTVVVQQVVALGGGWLKLLRLAVALGLALVVKPPAEP